MQRNDAVLLSFVAILISGLILTAFAIAAGSGALFTFVFAVISTFVAAFAAAELIPLDAVRNWARKLGFAGYNTIAIRGDEALRPIGPFMFDLAGPSWFSPVQASGGNPGFLVADVFAEGTLTEHHIAYFIRKVTMLRSMKPVCRVLPFIVADSYTGPALTAVSCTKAFLAEAKERNSRSTPSSALHGIWRRRSLASIARRSSSPNCQSLSSAALCRRRPIDARFAPLSKFSQIRNQ